MGDSLKLSGKDKRHRSSSSLNGLEGTTRSERRLDLRASIPEVDDQFSIAEERCAHLQTKLDLVKSLKRKKKLKKRSATGLSDVTPSNVITVTTQPKKRITPGLQKPRPRRSEEAIAPRNVALGYVDPDTLEQHRMLRGIMPKTKEKRSKTSVKMPETKRRRGSGGDVARAKVDGCRSPSPCEVACGDDYDDPDLFEPLTYEAPQKSTAKPRVKPEKAKAKAKRGEPGEEGKVHSVGPRARSRQQAAAGNANEGQVFELFNKTRKQNAPFTYSNAQNARKREAQSDEDIRNGDLEVQPSMQESKEIGKRTPYKYRSHRYEQPTVASQMKQAGVRYYYETANKTNIPFVVTKSTAPSHNIGVNIQQILNGVKIQQPLSGIPPTIAHHMGLRQMPHHPYNGTFSSAPPSTLSIDIQEFNALNVGPRTLRLPSYKVSYRRLLAMYRQGDGLVSRFLRAISRPHYFYTSMYDLVKNRQDYDGATSKGRGFDQNARQSLSEYTALYKEYEELEGKLLANPSNTDWQNRRDELVRELAAREEHIRRVVQEFRGAPNQPASVADSCRHSTFRLNLAENH